MDFIVEVIATKINVNKELYERFKENYSKIKDTQLESVNTSLSNNNTKIQGLKDRLDVLADSLKNIEPTKTEPINDQIKKTSDEIYELNIEKEHLEEQKIKLEANVNENIIPYENFLNFFDNAEQIIRSANDLDLIDQLVRNVFLNFIIKGGKVISYELNEPFKTYQKVGVIQMGWRNSDVLNISPSFSIVSLQSIKSAITKYFQLVGDSVAGVNMQRIDYKF